MTNTTKDSKHIPIRMCVVCREKVPKTKLLKMIKSKDGNISLFKQEQRQGKGIYLCPKEGCVSAFINHRRFRKSYCNLLTKEALNFLSRFIEGTLND